jgi:mRNA interferase MazF
MRRGEVYWARLDPPVGHRPVVIVTRTSAAQYRSSVTVALVTSHIRGIASEVEVGSTEGLRRKSVIICDNLMTIRKSRLDPKPMGRLPLRRIAKLDAALCFALGITVFERGR